MELHAEGDSGVRIITARHISADKAFAGTNNAINATLLCHNYSLQPDFGTYLAAFQKYSIGLWGSGLVILLTICLLYGLTMRKVWRHSRSSAGHAAVVLAVYPQYRSLVIVYLTASQLLSMPCQSKRPLRNSRALAKIL